MKIPKLPIKTWLIISGGSVILLTFLWISSCGVYNSKLSLIKGQYEERLRVVKADNEMKDRVIETALKARDEATERIKKLLENVGKPTPTELAKDKEIASLRSKLSDLEASGDISGALATAKEEIQKWSEKFSLAEVRHKDEIFTLNREWQVKYDLQIKITDQWIGKFNNMVALQDVAVKLNKALESKVRGLQFRGTAKTVVILGALAYIILK